MKLKNNKKILVIFSISFFVIIVAVISIYIINNSYISTEESEAGGMLMSVDFENLADVPRQIEDVDIKYKGLPANINSGFGYDSNSSLEIKTEGELSAVDFENDKGWKMTEFKFRIFDDLKASPAVSISTIGAKDYLIVQFKDDYAYIRTPQKTESTQFKRYNGWYTVGLYVSDFGAYVTINEVYFISINYSQTLKNVDVLSLGNSWSEGVTYYDDIQVKKIDLSNKEAQAINDFIRINDLNKSFDFKFYDLYDDIYHSGNGSLSVKSDGSLNTYDVRFIEDNIRSIELYFYDNYDETGYFVVSVSDSPILDYIIVQASETDSEYKIRNTKENVSTGIKRSQGWHKIEFISDTEVGVYTKIDGKKVSTIENSQRLIENIDTLSLGTSYKSGANVYYDDIVVKYDNNTYSNGFEKSNIEKEFEGVATISFKGNTANIVKRTFNKHQNSMFIRGYIHYIGGLISLDIKNNNTENKEEIEQGINYIIDQYPNWGKCWLSQIPAKDLMRYVEYYKDNLSNNTLNEVQDILLDESDYWVYIFDEVKNNPKGLNLSSDLRQPTSKLATNTNKYIIDSIDVNNFTKAEENASIANLLLSVGYKYNIGEYKNYGDCYAKHTFSNNTTACGITTSNVDPNFILSEHTYKPNTGYVIGAMYSLVDSAYYIEMLGYDVPNELIQYMDGNYIDTEVWGANMDNCIDENLVIKSECGGGKDWGDQVFELITFMDVFEKERKDELDANIKKINYLTYPEDLFVFNSEGKPIDTRRNDLTNWNSKIMKFQQLVNHYYLNQE